LRALCGLWAYRIRNAECGAALALAQRVSNLPSAQTDPSDLLVGERMLGTTLYFLGHQINARRHLEHMLSCYPASIRWSHILRFQLDVPVNGRAALARILWLQGFPDQAMRTAQDNVEDARAVVLRHCCRFMLLHLKGKTRPFRSSGRTTPPAGCATRAARSPRESTRACHTINDDEISRTRGLLAQLAGTTS
jgi:hypothetical protein